MNKYLVRNFKCIENLGKVPAKVYRLEGRDKGHEQSSASNKVRFYSYMIKSYKVSIIKLSVIHDRMGIFISTVIPTVIYSR